MSTEAQKQPTASSLLREGSMGELKVVAYWIEKAEQFCFPPKSGGRPFASAWEPLARLSEAEQALQALREEVEGLRADSERYKWLRNSSAHQWTHPVVVSQERTEHGMRYLGPMTGKTLDSAIDAAIRNGGEGVDE
jgi:7-keto-8-aminopelargonate synthetase-like enzyme